MQSLGIEHLPGGIPLVRSRVVVYRPAAVDGVHNELVSVKSSDSIVLASQDERCGVCAQILTRLGLG